MKPYFLDTSTTRMFVIRNEEPEEACLNQVKARYGLTLSCVALGRQLCPELSY